MLLELLNVNTFYGASHVLQGINIKVAKGEVVGLLGRNGMGKSTTLKTIMGLVKPHSGSIKFQGREIAGSPPFKIARQGIGYVPEERRIFPELTVLDNLELGIRGGKIKDPGNIGTWTLERIFDHFPKLKERKNLKGRFLSGGEQQMLAIGRSLMGNPSLLLIDEPTEGLAPLLKDEVRDILKAINEAGVTIVLVEHNLRIALSLVTRVYLMGKSHIGYEGSTEELRNNEEIRAMYLEA